MASTSKRLGSPVTLLTAIWMGLAAFGTPAGSPPGLPKGEASGFLARYEVVRCLFTEEKLVLRRRDTRKLLVLREGDPLLDGALRVQRIARKQVILESTPSGAPAGKAESAPPLACILIEEREPGTFSVREVFRAGDTLQPSLPAMAPSSAQGEAVQVRGSAAAEEKQPAPESKTRSGMGK